MLFIRASEHIVYTAVYMPCHVCTRLGINKHVFTHTYTDVYMPACMSAHMPAHMHKHMSIRMFTHASTKCLRKFNNYAFTHVCICAYYANVCTPVYNTTQHVYRGLHTCLHSCLHICLHTCLHTCLYTCLQTCLQTCSYTHPSIALPKHCVDTEPMPSNMYLNVHTFIHMSIPVSIPMSDTCLYAPECKHV